MSSDITLVSNDLLKGGGFCALLPFSRTNLSRILILPVLLQVILFTGVFIVGLSSDWSWKLLTVFYYFLPLLLVPGSHIFLRLFDLSVLSIFFLLATANVSVFLTAGIFFGLLGACRVYKDSFFLRLFSRRIHFFHVLSAGLQSLFFGFLSLLCFNSFLSANIGDSATTIIWAGVACSMFWSLGMSFDLGAAIPFKTRKKTFPVKNLDSSYREVMERFMSLSNRIISYAREQQDQELIDFMGNLQNTGVELIFRGNELFLFLREMKHEATGQKGSKLEMRNGGEELFLQEREEILRQKVILLDELNTEEKKLWGTLENMILRMDNLSLSLIGKKGTFLFDSGSEIGILNKKMEEAIVFLDEKRRAMKLLSDS